MTNDVLNSNATGDHGPAPLGRDCLSVLLQVLDAHPAMALLVDPAERAIIHANRAACAFYGYGDMPGGMSGLPLAGLEPCGCGLRTSPADRPSVNRCAHVLRDKTLRNVEIRTSPVFKADGRPALLAIVTDLDGLPGPAAAGGGGQAGDSRHRLIAEHAFAWEVLFGPGGEPLYSSPSCLNLTGRPASEFLNRSDFLSEVLHPGDLDAFRAALDRVAAGVERASGDFRIILPDGTERWAAFNCHRVHDAARNYQGLRCSFLDITDRKLIEAQLQHQAFHDPLTGLPNRALCLDRIRQALERSKRRGNYLYAVIFLDVDRFKVINDSLGHAVGDQLLVGIARSLQSCVRSLDTVARLGGDEFVMVLEEIGSHKEVIRIAKRIGQVLATPFSLCGHDVRVSVSMGIVVSPALYDRPEDLLRNANIAMHRAKESGRNRFLVFHSKMLEDAINLMNMEIDMRRGLDNEEFFVVYQPIYSLPDRRLTGFEALLRWRHPRRGVVAPCEFIPIAEETGLIIPLGLWVLRMACRHMADWQRERPELAGVTVSINLSAKQLSQPDLISHVESTLCETGLNPACLKLEITESVIMENPEVSILKLKRLKALGLALSVDDFGTGYSSLSYLQRFPIDTLKVDRSFVSRMHSEPENKEIIAAVIALAHSLGMDVVAEGIEVGEQCTALENLKCESGQGFLFSRPVDADTASAMCLEMDKA